MRVTIGTNLLGDLDDDIPIGGFVASATAETQRGRGACSGGLQRLRDRGNVQVSFTVPTKRTFDSVAAAQKWVVDTAGAGGFSGLLLFVFADGSESRFEWAVARPSRLEHRGVLVSATWAIEAGAKLT